MTIEFMKCLEEENAISNMDSLLESPYFLQSNSSRSKIQGKIITHKTIKL